LDYLSEEKLESYNISDVNNCKMSSFKPEIFFRMTPDKHEFKRRVEELSGEKIDLCFQCGACSSGCPLIEEMDYLPSKIIRMVQIGMDDVLNSRTIWVCTTCFNCEVRCPRGIDIANVMESLRQIVLRQKFDRLSLDELTQDQLKELPPIALVSNQRKLSA
jgi:heterodisulfide reductase subunit C